MTQAPNIAWDGLRIHNMMLTPNQIQTLSNGRSPTTFGASLWSNWCFSDPDNFGTDTSSLGQNFQIMGGRPAPGVSSFCPASGGPAVGAAPWSGPQSLHFPGGTTIDFARIMSYTFPPAPFTVEGFIKVAQGSNGRFMFSFNTQGNDNCECCGHHRCRNNIVHLLISHDYFRRFFNHHCYHNHLHQRSHYHHNHNQNQNHNHPTTTTSLFVSLPLQPLPSFALRRHDRHCLQYPPS
jgi:hypothetical protein